MRHASCFLVALLATTAFVRPVSAQSVTPILPQGGSVKVGTASITTDAAGKQLSVVTQTSRTDITWRSFSIGADNTVTITQPGPSSLTINEITGGDPSRIFGALRSNGQVVLANPGGIWFGPSSKVDVGGLIATSASLSNSARQSFAGGGGLNLDVPGSPTASVVNDGSITVAQNGLAALVAPGVVNSGTISARIGRVQLASGTTLTADIYGDGLINLAVAGSASAVPLGPDGTPLTSAVANSGKIIVDGGDVRLSAADAGALFDQAIDMSGVIQATAVASNGGVVQLLSANGRVGLDGAIDVSSQSATGGSVTVKAGVLLAGGAINADGASGGTVNLAADRLLQSGTITATGTTGAGGTIALTAGTNMVQTVSARLAVDSGQAQGGSIRLSANAPGGETFSSALLSATGATGGSIAVLGDGVALAAASLDTSGQTAGGTIRVGGDLYNAADLPTASQTDVNVTTSLKADALRTGNGGSIAVWSSASTHFAGTASARGGSLGGNGGLVETSSLGTLTAPGRVDAAAPAGSAGTWLLDPKNIIVDSNGSNSGGSSGGSSGSGSFSFTTIDLNNPFASTAGGFGVHIVKLTNGNLVVADPGNNFNATRAGAVTLFNADPTSPHYGAVLGVLVGSHAYDEIGSGDTGVGLGSLGVVPLPNGNYVVDSPNWQNTGSTLTGRGAVTWVNGTTGATYGAKGLYQPSSPDQPPLRETVYVVDSTNSLVGLTNGDQIGSNGVIALANGAYVVNSQSDNKGLGAITWGAPDGSTVGSVLGINSLTGTTGAPVGTLYVSPDKTYYLVVNIRYGGGEGAVTWNGDDRAYDVGIAGTNSLIGSHTSDYVGSGGVTFLTDGNYTVSSPNYSTSADLQFNPYGSTIAPLYDGAVTWGSGKTGVHGIITASNSVIGYSHYSNSDPYFSQNQDIGYQSSSTAPDTRYSPVIGSGGVVALANGAYLIESPGFLPTYGANQKYATPCQCTGAMTYEPAGGSHGTVGASNSVIGSGTVTALPDGAYVVGTQYYVTDTNNAVVNNNSALVVIKAGATGDIYSQTTRIEGGQYDALGAGGITPILVNGTSGAYTGRFVVDSPNWNNGVGAVTVVTESALPGSISATNSLVGAVSGDRVGSAGVTMLTNGNMVVDSPMWGGNFGATTWLSGVTGKDGTGAHGQVSTANSITGDQAGDYVGTYQLGNPAAGGGVTALSDGNYVVSSPAWQSQAHRAVGAVTWGDGATGATHGQIDQTNSLIGATLGGPLGAGGIVDLPGSPYFVVLTPHATIGGGPVGGLVPTADTVGTDIYGGVSDVVPLSTSSFAIGFPSATPIGQSGSTNGRVLIVTIGPSGYRYQDSPSSNVTITPQQIAQELAGGTGLLLQANTDVTVNQAINAPAAAGVTLEMDAGRSILIKEPISVGAGNLNLVANDPNAQSVNRDSGTALIQTGENLLTAGNISLRLNADGSSGSEVGSGSEPVRVSTSGGVSVGTNGASVYLESPEGDLRIGVGATGLNTDGGTSTTTGVVELIATNGGITQTAPIVTHNQVALSAAGGAIVLTDPGNHIAAKFDASGTPTGAGEIQITTHGSSNVTLVNSTDVVLNRVDVGDSTIPANLSITATGNLTGDPTQPIDASAQIVLDDPVHVTGLATLNAAGQIRETANGSIATPVGLLAVSATDQVNLNGQNTVTSVAGAAQTDFTLNTIRSLSIDELGGTSGITVAKGPIHLVVGGDLTQTAPIAATTLNATTTGKIDLENVANALSDPDHPVLFVGAVGGALLDAGGDITIENTGGLNLSADSGGNLKADSSAGGIYLQLANVRGSQAVLTAQGSVFGPASSTFTAKQAAIVSRDGAVQFNTGGVVNVPVIAGSANGDFQFNTTTGLHVGTVAGYTGIAAPDFIVGLTSGAAVDQDPGATIKAAQLNVSAQGTIQLGSATILNTIAPTSTGGDGGVVSLQGGAGVSFVNDGDLALGKVSAGGALDITSQNGFITTNAAVSASQAIAMTAAGTITQYASAALSGLSAELRSTGGDVQFAFGGQNAVSSIAGSAKGNFAFSTSTPLSVDSGNFIDGINAGGQVTLVADRIAQTQKIVAAGGLGVQANGASIILANQQNSIAGKVSLLTKQAGNVTLFDSVGFSLGDSSIAKGGLVLNSQGAITITGAVTSTGGTTYLNASGISETDSPQTSLTTGELRATATSGDIFLPAAANAIAIASGSTPGKFTLKTGGDLTVGGANPGITSSTGLSLNAAGSLTVSSSTNSTGQVDLTAGTGSIDATMDIVSSQSVVDLNAGKDATFRIGNNSTTQLNIGNSTVGGTLSVLYQLAGPAPGQTVQLQGQISAKAMDVETSTAQSDMSSVTETYQAGLAVDDLTVNSDRVDLSAGTNAIKGIQGGSSAGTFMLTTTGSLQIDGDGLSVRHAIGAATGNPSLTLDVQGDITQTPLAPITVMSASIVTLTSRGGSIILKNANQFGSDVSGHSQVWVLSAAVDASLTNGLDTKVSLLSPTIGHDLNLAAPFHTTYEFSIYSKASIGNLLHVTNASVSDSGGTTAAGFVCSDCQYVMGDGADRPDHIGMLASNDSGRMPNAFAVDVPLVIASLDGVNGITTQTSLVLKSNSLTGSLSQTAPIVMSNPASQLEINTGIGVNLTNAGNSVTKLAIRTSGSAVYHQTGDLTIVNVDAGRSVEIATGGTLTIGPPTSDSVLRELSGGATVSADGTASLIASTVVNASGATPFTAGTVGNIYTRGPQTITLNGLVSTAQFYLSPYGTPVPPTASGPGQYLFFSQPPPQGGDLFDVHVPTDLTNVNLDTINWGGDAGGHQTFNWSLSGTDTGTGTAPVDPFADINLDEFLQFLDLPELSH